MADPKQLTEEQLRLQKALDKLLEKNSDQLAKQIADNKKINELYKSRLDSEVKLADFSEIIAQNNKIARLEAQEAARVVSENLERQRGYKEDILKIQQDLQELSEKESKKLEEIDKLQTKINQGENQAGKNQSKRAKKEQQNRKDQMEALKANLKAIKEETDALKKIRKQRVGQHVQDKELLSLQVQKRNTVLQTNDANENLQASTRNFIKTFTGVTDMSDSFLGSLVNSNNAVGQIGNTMKATFTGPNMAFAVLSKIFESTLAFMKQFDTLAANFRKNTGIIDRGFGGIEQRIVNVQRANLRMGVSMDEAFQAANSLTAEMASFTSMTDDAQATVLQAATVLQEFGVGAQTTAQIFNNFSKGLGFNAQQLERLSTQLMGISTSLKIPPQIIATEFNAASKELMKYGDDMVDVFKGIAEQSKQTGIAMGELLGIVKQFDTFEGAGAAVGKLNAILGGPYLNAINMVYATEEQRIKQLRQSIQLSGRQFNQLSRHEQQAIAAAAGISDMTVAARLFGGTNSEFAKTQMSMKEMQERAAKAQAVQEKFTQVMQSFAIALGPVVHLLGFVADGFLMVMNPVGEIMRIFGSDNSGLIGMFGAITPLIYAAGAAMAHFNVQLFAAKISMAEIFLPITTALVVFGAFKSMLESMEPGLRTIVGLFIGIAGAIALALAIPSVGGSLLALAAAGAGVGAITAGIYGVVSGIGEFGGGKDKGVSARGGMGVLAEPGSGPEVLMKGNGDAYLVSTPSLVELNPQDTVYSNAETKAMLNGGGNNSAMLAEMRQMMADNVAMMRQNNEAANRRAEALSERPIVVEVAGKEIFNAIQPPLNRALGLSRRGTLT